MNAGTNYTKAKRHAQANENQTGVNWSMHMYNGVWWIERSRFPESSVPYGVQIIRPEPRETTRETDRPQN